MLRKLVAIDCISQARNHIKHKPCKVYCTTYPASHALANFSNSTRSSDRTEEDKKTSNETVPTTSKAKLVVVVPKAAVEDDKSPFDVVLIVEIDDASSEVTIEVVDSVLELEIELIVEMLPTVEEVLLLDTSPVVLCNTVEITDELVKEDP